MNKKDIKNRDPFWMAIAGLALGAVIGGGLSNHFDFNAIGTEAERAEIQYVLEKANHPLAAFKR
ncbi:MAG: hypothetical protein CL565_06830 [Alphaproteobacteria bacterium]|nr:hypothetical protein [Alphaproteobacteria bacterium]